MVDLDTKGRPHGQRVNKPKISILLSVVFAMEHELPNWRKSWGKKRWSSASTGYWNSRFFVLFSCDSQVVSFRRVQHLCVFHVSLSRPMHGFKIYHTNLDTSRMLQQGSKLHIHQQGRATHLKPRQAKRHVWIIWTTYPPTTNREVNSLACCAIVKR